jgi:hypothetical protein
MSGTRLATVGVTLAAMCIWLPVRIINRRERWAKWTLAAAVCVPLLYVFSFGPACWFSSRMKLGDSAVSVFYLPITLALAFNNDTTASRLVRWYAEVHAEEDWQWWTRMWFDENPDGTWTSHLDTWTWQYVPPAPPAPP